MDELEIKRSVRENYGAIARSGGAGCGCGCGSQVSLVTLGKTVGYAEEDLAAAPEGANMGLGCGNPVALASLKEGETVLDLGAGGGFDCFLAARRVGERGKVIGVDMTPEMVEKARTNAEKGGYSNVEFRLGEIEHLPVADNSVDVIISNCVINLAPNKRKVFDEAFRVLKPGGRLMVSDIVLSRPLPDDIQRSIKAYVACVSGAETQSEYLQTMREAGFADVEVVDEARFPVDFLADYVEATPEQLQEISSAVVSLKVRAAKPARGALGTTESPACCAQLGAGSSCCGPVSRTEAPPPATPSPRRLLIEFLYIDLSVCTRCRGTDSSLEEALSEVARVLEATGLEVEIRKIHVQTEEQAAELGFVSSPTIRVNGKDIQMDVRESLCESCGDLCGEDVDCRVWVYQGKEYTVPPKAMIIEAILREVYSGTPESSSAAPRKTAVPENLRRFFAAKQRSQGDA